MAEQLRIRLPDTPLSKEELRHECALRVPRVLNALLQIADNEDNPPAARIQAGTVLLNYAYGKPRQEIEQVGAVQPLQVLIRHFNDDTDLLDANNPTQ